MTKIKNNYFGIAIVILVFGCGLVKKYFLDVKKNSVNSAVIFSDASGLISPPFIHSDNKKYYESRNVMGYFRSLFFAPGIAVADLNGDGFQDFVITNSGAGDLPQVYINNHGEGFVNKTAEHVKNVASKTDPYDSNISPFLFDFDNDDDLDLFVTSVKCAKFFLNESGKFVFQVDHPLSNDCEGSISALPYDFNKDGKLELMVIRYWNNRWQKILEKSSGDMKDEMKKVFKGGNSVAFESNDGGFSSIYSNDLQKNILDKLSSKWSFDALVTDLDNDGVDELVVANDFGDDRIYNFNNLQFLDVSKNFIFPDRRNGMSLAANYLPNDPYPFLYVSNIWVKNYIEKGNFYWQYSKWNKKLSDKAEEQNLDNCGWAWSAAFGDFNMDGFNDVYAANGFMATKENDNKDEAENYFKMASLASLPTVDSVKKVPLSADRISASPSVGGQKDVNKIYSVEEKKFVDVKKDTSLDKIWNGRAAAMIDFDNDGDLDLLVTAQNDNLRLLKNVTQEYRKSEGFAELKNWIGFEIKNQQFIRKITLLQNGDEYYKDWQGGRSGFLTTSDQRIYFTMKNENEVEVTFQFVDGRKVTKKFSPGKYYNLGKI